MVLYLIVCFNLSDVNNDVSCDGVFDIDFFSIRIIIIVVVVVVRTFVKIIFIIVTAPVVKIIILKTGKIKFKVSKLNQTSGENFIQKSYPNWRGKVIHTNKSCEKFYPEELSKFFLSKT